MNNFDFYAPTYFAFGRGSQEKAGELVKRFGGSKALVVYGGGSVKRNGVLAAVESSLDAAGVEYVEMGGVQPNPRSGMVYEGIALAKSEGADFVLAVGGGSTIDTAKAIALGVPYEGDFWDYYENPWTVTNALPVGTVLTIAAAGSEGSPDTVITNENNGLKWAAHGDTLRPRFSILNPEYTCTLPPYQTACGITDIMIHVFERYFTNTRDVELTDRLCEAVLKTVIKEAPKVMADPGNYEARANIMWAGTVAHNNICGLDRDQDWASHDLEHELSSFYDCAHGAGLAVMCPAWMTYVYKHDVNRFAQFAVRVWDCEMDFADPEATALQGIERTREFFKSLGMPGSIKAFGGKEEDIPQMVEHLGKRGDHVGGFVKIYAEDASAIYRLAL